MPEYYKTSKGYCYKKTQSGGSKRISKSVRKKISNLQLFSSDPPVVFVSPVSRFTRKYT